MIREFNERMRIIRACPVKVFAAGNGGPSSRYWYPYKLQKIGGVEGDATDHCLEFMLDSAIGEEDVTNRDVIEAAIWHNADYVVPKDYLQDPARTTESIREFLDLYEKSNCRARVLLPLQPPHGEHIDDVPNHPAYMVGGVKNADPIEQVEALQTVRDKAGRHAYIHGLGMGSSLDVVRAIRQDPHLVDSVDTATPYHKTKKGDLIDKLGHDVDFGIARGERNSTVQAQFVQAMLIHINFVMSDLCDDADVEDAMEQTTLQEKVYKYSVK